MESQMQPPLGHVFDQDQDPNKAGLHSVEDEGKQHHEEKKSVLKKVKDKAKKIKEILKNDGHRQDHPEHENERDYARGLHDGYEGQEEEEEEEEGDDNDETEKMVEDPEVHGAPIYESTAITGSVPMQVQAANLEKPTAGGEDSYDVKSAVGIERENVSFGLERSKMGIPGGLQEDPHAPKTHPGCIPPPNYETKVADPTGEGGREVGMSPLIDSFLKMEVSEKKSGKESEQTGYTGSHDQFARQITPTESELDPTTSTTDTSREERASNQGGIVDKMSVATSLIADKAISAKDAVVSKLGYGGTKEAKTREIEESKDREMKSGASAPPAEGYVGKVAATVSEKLGPVYEKAAGAGSSVVSRVKGSGTGNEGAEISGGSVLDKGGSAKKLVSEKLKPGEEDKALFEVIMDTLLKTKEGLVKKVESSPIAKAKPVESKPVGKVTESEEVARNPGTGMENVREGEDAIAAGRESSGSGVVERLKGAVSSWISKGGEEQGYSKGSANSSDVRNEGASASGEVEHRPSFVEERSLIPESGN